MLTAGLLLLSVAFLRNASPETDIVLCSPRGQVVFSAENGSILQVASKGQTGSMLQSGEHGLWQARLVGGKTLDAASFSSRSTERTFRSEGHGGTEPLRFLYKAPEILVVVTVSPCPEGVDFVADITARGQTLDEFALPGRLRFSPDALRRFVCPMDGNTSVGAAFSGDFFKRQALPTSWSPSVVGGMGYEKLFGDGPVMRPDADPPVQLRFTDDGRKWLGNVPSTYAEPGGKRKPDGKQPAMGIVNRPPKAGQADLVLADSVHGPYFSASRLGGDGRLWRIGGNAAPQAERLVMGMIGSVVERLAMDRPTKRSKVGMIALRYGPHSGAGTSVTVGQWRNALRELETVKAGKLQFVALDSVAQIDEARASDDFLVILNPYGEWMPVHKPGDMKAAVASILDYVRKGGNWFEVGGFPFFMELLPASHHHQYTGEYPPAFADFFHLQSETGEAAIYRMQPRDWKPWQGARDSRAIFIPGRFGCGGDDRGGWCDRSYQTTIPKDTTWRCPAVRLSLGRSAIEAIADYTRVNGITRRLEDKMSPEVLEKFKRSTLVYYDGDVRAMLRHLDLLPVPCQIHFAAYLHGGFDKQYPDHLPPHPNFGTPRQMREFFDAAHERGHLVVPYTNPTWWCDSPKGATFEKNGDEPLLKQADGKPAAERYGDATGFTVCHWSPEVQEANRRTLRQFRDEYPVDILFEDQCGARGWRYDANKASPTPYAYTEGLLSMIDEESRLTPLSTESGWDRVVNAESQLCGMTWLIVPTEHGPAWRQLLKERYDPGLWEIFPLAQYIAHDKLAMIHHDLGQFVTNRQVLSWTLGLGYSMSFRLSAPSLQNEGTRNWLLWLDRIQKSICSRYVGSPLQGFRHVRDPKRSSDDGVLSAEYGRDALRLTANLDSYPREVEGRQLAGFGYFASATHLTAGSLAWSDRKTGASDHRPQDGGSFVAETDGRKTDVWFYGRAGDMMAFVLPDAVSHSVAIVFDGGSTAQTSVGDGVHRVRLPNAEERNASSEAKIDHSPAERVWHGTVAK
jgi:hypothetical protein